MSETTIEIIKSFEKELCGLREDFLNKVESVRKKYSHLSINEIAVYSPCLPCGLSFWVNGGEDTYKRFIQYPVTEVENAVEYKNFPTIR
jgi:hypothetical protein